MDTFTVTASDPAQLLHLTDPTVRTVDLGALPQHAPAPVKQL